MDDWFCEAAWDGEFNDGGFDRTDIVAGSGGRKRSGQLVFVSAGNTVDRLVSLNLAGTILVSNSLACLAATADLDFLLDHDWHAAFHSIVKGIEHYQSEIPSSRGNILLTYYRNLVWNGHTLRRVEKPRIHRNLSSFECYYDFLVETLHCVHLNSADNSRRYPFQLLTTLSTGYDSPTVTAVAKTVAPKVRGFTFGGMEEPSTDSGSEIAGYLGVDLDIIDIGKWRDSANPEVPHIAADCLGEEVQYTAAASILSSRILLTGFHGDVVWGKDIDHASENFVRGDPSGLSLTEYRLWANFLHCPIPFWGARQSADIVRLSNQQTMHKWDVSGGYSRPICRRIVESSGVPRELFGRKKKAASSWPNSSAQFLTPQSMENYLQWLEYNRPSLIHGPFSTILTSRNADRIFFKMFKSTQRAAGKLGSIGHSFATLDLVRRPLHWFETVDWANNPKPPWVLPLRRFLFPWAIDMAKRKYIGDK
ncbi:hypothetical protein [Nitrosospira sp. Nl5]|uniref:hypothetical protein n=1 Tax=Nitrosospira sp. Nl5 TaxID=200120 RepID=UPI00115FA5D7|nr:hypothetical protein [Nitrosospira sp. Nl5]